LLAARRGDPAFPVLAQVERALQVPDVEHLVGSMWASTRGTNEERLADLAGVAGPQLDEILRSVDGFLTSDRSPEDQASILRTAGAPAHGADVEVLEWLRELARGLQATRSGAVAAAT
jgi:hypothetical protein